MHRKPHPKGHRPAPTSEENQDSSESSDNTNHRGGEQDLCQPVSSPMTPTIAVVNRTDCQRLKEPRPGRRLWAIGSVEESVERAHT